MSQKANEPHLTGLTDQEVLSSREKYGVNLLTPPKRPSMWKLYLEKFQSRPCYPGIAGSGGIFVNHFHY